MECKMDIIGSLSFQDGSTPKFIERIIEIIKHKTCKWKMETITTAICFGNVQSGTCSV